MTESNVIGHWKYLKNGKAYWWNPHIRIAHYGFTEKDTEDHKKLVSKVKELFSDHAYSRYILNRDNICCILSIDKEIYISGDNKRRCDLLFNISDGRNVVIECQIGKLSSDEIYDRTLYYISKGYDIIWIRKSGVNYQRIYYWLISDCNRKPNERLVKESEGALSYSYACRKEKYYADIKKGGFGLIYIRLFKKR